MSQTDHPQVFTVYLYFGCFELWKLRFDRAASNSATAFDDSVGWVILRTDCDSPRWRRVEGKRKRKGEIPWRTYWGICWWAGKLNMLIDEEAFGGAWIKMRNYTQKDSHGGWCGSTDSPLLCHLHKTKAQASSKLGQGTLGFRAEWQRLLVLPKICPASLVQSASLGTWLIGTGPMAEFYMVEFEWRGVSCLQHGPEEPPSSNSPPGAGRRGRALGSWRRVQPWGAGLWSIISFPTELHCKYIFIGLGCGDLGVVWQTVSLHWLLEGSTQFSLFLEGLPNPSRPWPP